MDSAKITELWALYSICKHTLQIIRDLSASLIKIGGIKQQQSLVLLNNKVCISKRCRTEDSIIPLGGYTLRKQSQKQHSLFYEDANINTAYENKQLETHQLVTTEGKLSMIMTYPCDGYFITAKNVM